VDIFRRRFGVSRDVLQGARNCALGVVVSNVDTKEIFSPFFGSRNKGIGFMEPVGWRGWSDYKDIGRTLFLT
jgi:hypothetical protein